MAIAAHSRKTDENLRWLALLGNLDFIVQPELKNPFIKTIGPEIMELKGEYNIPAPREEVWAALNDPAVLEQCIPGCDEFEMVSPTEFNARVTTKIGPVKAKFKGAVTLSNINPPKSYTISGQGEGGVAGHAKGGADVTLAEADGGTLLSYKVNAQVGGKIAQIGSRLISSTAKKLAAKFFSAFSQKVGG
ncbi:MAG: CoxG family protein [Hyphomicrobiales bacterium]